MTDGKRKGLSVEYMGVCHLHRTQKEVSCRVSRGGLVVRGT